ncbi:SLATT domain-containing protein [Aliivibrio fischeri]|nr:SLATT domain-containing protein [Aliivibrio fischeri]
MLFIGYHIGCKQKNKEKEISNKEETKNLYKELYKDTKIVASSRFNKSKRLYKINWWALFSISSLSISLILITILENTHSIKAVSPFIFTGIFIQSWIFTVIASIIILALSIAISSAKFEVDFEKLTDSAIRINRISRQIEAEIQSKSIDYNILLSDYQTIISENQINHDEVDYRISRCRINKKKGKRYYFDRCFLQYTSLIPFYLIMYIALSVIISITEQILVIIC